MNNALVLYLSDALAARLVREAGLDPGRQVERAYRLAFGRRPLPDEQERGDRGRRAVRRRHACTGDLQQQRIPVR